MILNFFQHVFSAVQNMFVNANEIIPGIYLGSFRAAHDTKFLFDNNIEVIVNCTTNIPFVRDTPLTASVLSHVNKIFHVRIPVEDSLLEKDIVLMEEYLHFIVPFLVQRYRNNKRILIHCREGKQRSSIVVASLLKVLSDTEGDSERSERLAQRDTECSVKKTMIPNFGCNGNAEEQFHKIYKYLLQKRPQVFTYGLRVNFKESYWRYFNIYA